MTDLEIEEALAIQSVIWIQHPGNKRIQELKRFYHVTREGNQIKITYKQ